MPALKTITLMIGSKEKSWKRGGLIELRDLEQWFVDGRERNVQHGGVVMDIGDVARYLMNLDPLTRAWPVGGRNIVGGYINVRLVAWKRGN